MDEPDDDSVGSSLVVVSATWMRVVDPKVCASVERFIVEREMARKERPDERPARGEKERAGSRRLVLSLRLKFRTYQCVIMVGQWSVERHQIPLSVYLRPASSKGTVNPIRILIRSLDLSDILPLLLQIFGNRAARADSET